LIIDEVDVFFSRSFYGQTFKPVALYQNGEIIEIIKYIYKYGKPEGKGKNPQLDEK
jgi:hypothetical protein